MSDSPERQPIREGYDAVVDLHPYYEIAQAAYALVKLTFSIRDGLCRLDAPEPLEKDLRDDELKPRIPAGSDFWFFKEATDVIVQGSAFAPGGSPVRAMLAAVTVGNRRKVVSVQGRRIAEWNGSGRVRPSEAEPFTEVPVSWENAYGGCDARVPIEPRPPPELADILLRVDHPGLYPRNPFGKGYIVLPDDPNEEVELPRIEDPRQPLTAERLCVRDPRLWYLQPPPAAFDWVHPMMFPRFAYLGVDAWCTPPDDQRLPEVTEGTLPHRFREAFPAIFETGEPPPPAFFQEGSSSLIFPSLEPGTPIVIEGMHPEFSRIEASLPNEPYIEFQVEGSRETARPHLAHVVVRPNDLKLTVTYSALLTKLPRSFVAGLHREIPLSIIVGRDRPISYAECTKAQPIDLGKEPQ